MKLTKEKIDLLTNGTREERVYATARSFKLFAIFYFTKYFTYQLAPFHDDFFQDFEDLVYGRVKDAKVLRSIPLLDQAALDAVKQWVYTPTLLNGVPVPVIMTVTVNFTLQ